MEALLLINKIPKIEKFEDCVQESLFSQHGSWPKYNSYSFRTAAPAAGFDAKTYKSRSSSLIFPFFTKGW